MNQDVSQILNTANSTGQRYNPSLISSYQKLGGTLSNGAIPLLTADFPTTPAGTKNTGVITSNTATDHISNMGQQITQANKDVTNATQVNNQNAQQKAQTEQQQKQQEIENQQNQPKEDTTTSLLKMLGENLGSEVKPDATQQGVIDANTAQNKIDEQNLRTVGDAIDSMNAGTYPLSPTEKASVANVATSFSTAFEAANRLIQNQLGGTNKLNAKYGLQMYSPQEAISNIATIIQNGNLKIGEINSKLLDAQDKLTQAFKDSDFKTATSLYNKISETIKERKQEIKTINDEVSARKKELMEYINDERDREEKVQAEVTKNKNEILQKLGQNQAPKEVIEAVGKARTVEDAIALAGDSLYSENDKLDAMYKRAQIDKIYSDIKKSNEDAKSDAQDDPAQIVAYASEYASTGKIPTGLPKGKFGQIAQYAKELPKTPGQVISVSTGVSPSDNATLQTALGSLYSATELAKQLKQLDQERWGGILAGTAGKLTGSDTQTKYMDLRGQIVDLIARARSGAALTPSEEKRYTDMLPGRFSESFGLGADSQVKIDNFINAITSDAKNKASAQGWAINGLSDADVGGQKYKVGDVITNSSGVQGRVNADGSITLMQ